MKGPNSVSRARQYAFRKLNVDEREADRDGPVASALSCAMS